MPSAGTRSPRDGLARTIVRAASGLIASALLACGSDQAVTFTSTEPPEPASVRLFINGGDVTDHVPLNSGHPQELEVRLHAASGVRITGYDDHFALSLQVTPASLATSSDVAGRPLVKLLTPTGPAGEPGSIHVTVQHAHTTTVRTFGPFELLVH